jgi:PAS domain S-box-containing protein
MRSAIRLHRAILAASVLVPATVFAAAAWWNRGEVLREGTETVERTSAVIQEHAARVFDTAALVLGRIEERIRGLDDAALAAPATSEFLGQIKAPLEQLVSVWVSDAEGRILAGSQPWTPANRIVDRDFFRAHAEGTASGIYLSEAFIGRATNTASFALSLGRRDAEGRFLGVIHVALSPDYFTRFFAEATPTFPGAAALFRTDGAVLGRHPPSPGVPAGLGRLGPGSPVLAGVARRPERDVFWGTSTLDGQDRIYAYRKVGGWPAYVGFGADSGALLQRWRRNVTAYGLVAAVASLTLLLVGWLALRRVRMAEAAQAALRREAAARAAAEAREAAEARFRAVFESQAIGMSVFDLATGETLLANDRLLEMTGGTREAFEAGRWDWRRVTPPESLRRDEAAVAEARERGFWSAYEKEYLRPDGTRVPVRISSAPMPGEKGRVVVTVQDISGQREAEARRDLLMRELDHRAKNALAVVHAAVRLTPREDAESYATALEGRVRALARAHGLLAEGYWSGADLRALAEGELSPFLPQPGGGAAPRAELSGPPMRLGPGAAQAVSMALHELATNATKYGALSVPEGRVRLTWRLDEAAGRLVIAWEETGGPAIAGVPPRRGFGTRVLEGTIRRQLGGAVRQHWLPGGLVCELELPLDRAAAPGAEPAVAVA